MKAMAEFVAVAAVASLFAMGCQSPTTSSVGSSAARTAISTSGATQIAASSYTAMSGVQTESCSEGGLDVGWIDAGDWMVYPVTVATAGNYVMSFRVASPNAGKTLTLDLNAGATQLGAVNVPNTGAWETWTTVSTTVSLPAGTSNLGVNAGTGGFNLQWLSLQAVGSETLQQAESYSAMSGVITEASGDTGGTQDVGGIDAGDWMVYPITIPTTGTYVIQYRVSSIYAGKYLSTDLNAGSVQLGQVSIPNTGNWQSYVTVNQTVTLNAGSYNFGINGGSGGFNINWFQFAQAGVSSGSTGGGSGSGSTGNLINLNAGKQMTFQFVNNTGGKYSNSQIYVLCIARDTTGVFSYLDANGNFNHCVVGGNANAVSIKLSDFPGFQFPSHMDSGRLYVSLGKPLDIPFVQAGDGTVGIAYPNIENSSDANINTYFDWVEFAVLNNQVWCNTTQVDQFGLPMTMELFQSNGSSYTSVDKVGITESRSAIYSEYAAAMPAAFQQLAGTYRILAPIHGGFRPGQTYGTYWDSYINSLWSQYSSSNLSITVGTTVYSGRVQGDGRMAFTTPGDGNTYYVSKPTDDAVWGGLAALATGNPVELAIEAQVCAAFHRHVLNNSASLYTPSSYYQTAPMDYYSKFWHTHSLNNRAYGFCYDDVNNQSSTMSTTSPRGIVLTIGF